jgi:hypothetical protein
MPFFTRFKAKSLRSIFNHARQPLWLVILAFATSALYGKAPNITNLTPTSGRVGATVTIAGTSFGGNQGTSTVTFAGTSAGTATNWGASSITVNVPNGAATGSVVVTVNGVPSNGVTFTVLPTPNITSLTPASGRVGATVTIAGTNFGAAQGLYVISALGRGLGVSAAHEIAHQFVDYSLTNGDGLMDANPETDPNARGTFNATGCNGSPPSLGGDPSPWIGYWPSNPPIYLHWEKQSLNQLTTSLGAGWHK